MKNHLILSLMLLVLLSAFSAAQDKFEGKVEFKMTSDDESMNLKYFVKGGKIKIDIAGENDASMIFDSKNSKMLIIVPEEKMYMEMPSMMSYQKSDEKEGNGTFTNTGEKKEIKGYVCEKWIYKDDESEVDSWLTKELGSFVFFSNPMDQNSDRPGWQTRLESEGYFPMLVIAKDSDGDVETQMEVTSVDEMSLNDDMFSPPSGYQKLSMPGF